MSRLDSTSTDLCQLTLKFTSDWSELDQINISGNRCDRPPGIVIFKRVKLEYLRAESLTRIARSIRSMTVRRDDAIRADGDVRSVRRRSRNREAFLTGLPANRQRASPHPLLARTPKDQRNRAWSILLGYVGVLLQVGHNSGLE